ncbi:MAG: glycoside hydrolase family 113 [Promethearchaeota archaeon]
MNFKIKDENRNDKNDRGAISNIKKAMQRNRQKYNKTKIALFILFILFAAISLNNFYMIYRNKLVNVINGSGPETYDNIPFQKGMSFTKWDFPSYNSSEAFSELDEMKRSNIEWVALNVWWVQDNLSSTEIMPFSWSDSDENITAFINYAHSIGLKILFKPMLDTKTKQWRSYINASDEWFESYTNFIVHLAELAENSSVEIFSIGCEMGSMQVREDKVRSMIHEIRNVYSGKLTYAANHDSFWYINWWDEMDIIGIDSWFPFTMDSEPDVEELTSVWDGFYDRFEAFSEKWNKPILFVEFGAQARDGSNIVPNDNKFNLNQDVEELRDIYLSLFKSKIWTAPWFKGVYWWMWEIGEPNLTTDIGFSPKLDPIKSTINYYYAFPHEINSNNYLISSIFYAVLIIAIIGIAFGAFLFAYRNQTKPLNSRFAMDPIEKSEKKIEGQNKASDDALDSTIKLKMANKAFIGIILGIWLSWMFLYYLQHAFATLYSSFTFSQFLGLPTNTLAAKIILNLILSLIPAIILLIIHKFSLMKNKFNDKKNIRFFIQLILFIMAILSQLYFYFAQKSQIEQIYLDTYFALSNLMVGSLLVAVAFNYCYKIYEHNSCKEIAYESNNLDSVDIEFISTSKPSFAKIILYSIISMGLILFSSFISDYMSALIITLLIIVAMMISNKIAVRNLKPTNGTKESDENIEKNAMPKKIKEKDINTRTKKFMPFNFKMIKKPKNAEILYRNSTILQYLLISIATMLIYSALSADFIMINFNLKLVAKYFAPFVIFGAIEVVLIFLNRSTDKINPTGFVAKNDIFKKLTSFSQKLIYISCLIITSFQILFGLNANLILSIFASIILFEVIYLLWLLLNQYGSNPYALLSTWLCLLLFALLITVGFLLNGIKASLIYVVTFFDIVDGKIVVRTDFESSLNYDVFSLIIRLVYITALIILLISYLIKIFTKKRLKHYGKFGK